MSCVVEALTPPRGWSARSSRAAWHRRTYHVELAEPRATTHRGPRPRRRLRRARAAGRTRARSDRRPRARLRLLDALVRPSGRRARDRAPGDPRRPARPRLHQRSDQARRRNAGAGHVRCPGAAGHQRRHRRRALVRRGRGPGHGPGLRSGRAGRRHRAGTRLRLLTAPVDRVPPPCCRHWPLSPTGSSCLGRPASPAGSASTPGTTPTTGQTTRSGSHWTKRR